MAAVMRGCRSLALMNSNWTSAPSAFEASAGLPLQLDVAGRDEVDPADDVKLRALGEGRGAVRRPGCRRCRSP